MSVVISVLPSPEPWAEEEALPLPPGADESQAPAQAGDPPAHDEMPGQLS